MSKTKERPGVMMYFHLLKPLKGLPKEQFADLIWALMEYAEFGVIPRFDDPMLALSWGYLEHAADLDRERYEERCMQARTASAKRWGRDADGTERMRTVPKYNTNAQADTKADTDAHAKADADAHTHASASASTQTEAGTEEQTPLPGGVPPRRPAPPLEIPRGMEQSYAWNKAAAASVMRREGADFDAWHEAETRRLVRQAEAEREAARRQKALEAQGPQPKSGRQQGRPRTGQPGSTGGG